MFIEINGEPSLKDLLVHVQEGFINKIPREYLSRMPVTETRERILIGIAEYFLIVVNSVNLSAYFLLYYHLLQISTYRRSFTYTVSDK